jgi:hypothetical protein
MEHPILFSTTMVKAILDDKKTKTRRVIKPQPDHCHRDIINKLQPYDQADWDRLIPQIGDKEIKCPYGKVGDVMWVRETWKYYEKAVGHGENFHVKKFLAYKADADNVGIQKSCEWYEGKWKPSIHMPRKACRIRLKITDIRIERLQDITEEDAKAEGVSYESAIDCNGWGPTYNDPDSGGYPIYKAGFEYLWDSINKDRGYGWDTNPWVWVVSFERIQP